MNPLEEFPVIRRWLYRCHWTSVAVLGAVQVGYAAVPDASAPGFLLPATAVLAYVGGILTATADTNVPTSRAPEPQTEARPHSSSKDIEEN